jgi:hypothetical protein
LNPAEEQSADVEVAIAAPDLAALIDGRLGFSALLLCGMVRELRPGLATRPDAFVVTSIHDTPPAGREEAILSGACLINLLLNRWRPDLATREMDVEIESCELERPLWRCPEETLDTQAWSARLPSCASYLDRAIWVDVAEAIWKHGDASAASGVRRWRDEVRYLAFPGLRPWISPGEVAVSGLSGTLVVSNFIEAQPHMGAGVRFPEEAYRRLLENVASSGIDRWAVIRAVPPGSSVPAWRFASLLPFTAERLRMDLTSRGWRGVLDDVVEGEGEMEPAWWLGVPPLGTDFPANEVMFESPSGEALPGLLYAARAVRRPPSGGFTPAFRLRLAPGYEATAVSLLRCLAEGGLRFSWLLSVHDTEELYPSARKLGCARWIQEVAVGCLRQSLELA